MVGHRIDPDSRPYDPAVIPAKTVAGIDPLLSLDVRVGRVVSAEPFPEARDPALKVTVDFGPVIGVLRTSAKVTNYDPDALVGRQVIGVVNLGVKKVAGFTSEFLVLGGLEADGTVRLLDADAPLPPGSVVG